MTWYILTFELVDWSQGYSEMLFSFSFFFLSCLWKCIFVYLDTVVALRFGIIQTLPVWISLWLGNDPSI